MLRGEHVNVTEDRAVLHTALRLPADATLEVDGQDVVADVHEVLGRVYAFADQVRSRRVDRRHRRADPHGRQHRHRRLRPRPGDGLRGARALPPARARVPLHQQHRPDRRRHDAGRPRPGDDAVHRVEQDLRHPRDPDQRPAVQGLAARRARPAPTQADAVRQALRRGLDRARQGRRLRHRPRQRLRVLGLGRRALLARLGDRHLAGRRDRARAVRRAPGRHARDRRALPHHAAGSATCRS